MTGQTAAGPVSARRAGGRGFRSLWISANLLGYGAAGAAFGALQRTRSQPYFEVVTSASAAIRIQALQTGESLAVFGALVGAAQWLALRRSPYARWWIPATAVGWSAAGILVGAISGLTVGSVSSIGPHRSPAVTAAGVLASALLVAFIPSGAQWLVLRRHTAHAGRWPLINLAGLIPGLTAAGLVVRGFLVEVVPWLTPYDFPSAKALVCVGAVTGLVYGATTARWVAGGEFQFGDRVGQGDPDGGHGPLRRCCRLVGAPAASAAAWPARQDGVD